MPGEPERLNHPLIVYFIGFIFSIITFAVIAGVLYHLLFAPHGPSVLRPLLNRMDTTKRSVILEEAKNLEEFEVHRHFHNIVEFPQLPEQDRPVCFICHSDYPHGKNKKTRSLLNMHTQYFVCETCHIKEAKDMELTYRWYSPVEEIPEGPFFGTSYHPENGNLMEVEDKFSKITPYVIKGDRLESAIQIQDAPLAQDYMRVRDQLTPEQRDGVKKKFHLNIKDQGHDCKACHAKKSILDYRKLGFAENRIEDLEQLNISGMITKYEDFYLPELFRDK